MKNTTSKVSSAITRQLREQFASCGTCDASTYFATKGEGIKRFDDCLRNYGLQFGICDIPNDSGRNSQVCILNCETGSVVGYAVITWYRMPSGRYEIIGYLC